MLGLTWAADWQQFSTFDLMSLVFNHKRLHPESSYTPSFRSADIDRLPYILAHGCDVDPTDTVLWVSRSPSKALEYGGETKVAMVFDARKLANSGQEVAADTASEELDRLSVQYPTLLENTDGQHLWLSRLLKSDRRCGTAYEEEYGRWIPGDPWAALRLLIILAHDASQFPHFESMPVANL